MRGALPATLVLLVAATALAHPIGGLPVRGLVLSLFGFNAGIELGQALVVAVVLPALALLKDTRWETRVIQSASLAILLVGALLFVERILL